MSAADRHSGTALPGASSSSSGWGELSEDRVADETGEVTKGGAGRESPSQDSDKDSIVQDQYQFTLAGIREEAQAAGSISDFDRLRLRIAGEYTGFRLMEMAGIRGE